MLDETIKEAKVGKTNGLVLSWWSETWCTDYLLDMANEVVSYSLEASFDENKKDGRNTCKTFMVLKYSNLAGESLS